MKITICIPAYNESQIIERTLKTINDFCLTEPKYDWQVIVANNGSTDDTGKLARQQPNTLVIDIETKGKGAAVIHTAKLDSSDIFCFIDADLSASPEALIKLIENIKNGADIAIGSRLLDKSRLQRSFFRTLSSRIFNTLRRVVLGIKVADSQCGLKVMNTRGRNILTSCVETGWFFDMELLTKAEQAGLTVREIAIPWQETVYPGRESKLGMIRDGIKGILAMLRIRNRESKNNTLLSPQVFALLAIASVVYSGFFLWHTNAAIETGKNKEVVYFERGDATGYVSMADSILQGDKSLMADDEATRGLRTPGYPLFLASIFFFERNPILVVILQIIIALGTIPFIYCLGQRLTNATVSFLATLAYVIYPTTAFLNTQILAETVYMFVTTLSLWLLLAAPTSWQWRYTLVGVTAGIAILIRPSFLYIIPLILLYTVLKEGNIWQKIIRVGIITSAVFIILAPWLHANNRDFGEASLSTAGNFNILYVYLPQFLAQNSEAEEGWLSIHQEYIDTTRQSGYEIGSHRANDFESQQIKLALAGNEVSYALFHIKRSILTFVSSGLKMVNNEMTELGRPIFSATPWLIQRIYTHGLSWDLIKNNSLAFIDAALVGLMALLMPISVIVAILRRDKHMLAFLLIFGMIMVTALLAGPNGNARYRMPLQPYIFLLAFSSLWIIFKVTGKYLSNFFQKEYANQ